MTFHKQIFYTLSTLAHVVPLLSSKTAELLANDVIDILEKAHKNPHLTLND